MMTIPAPKTAEREALEQLADARARAYRYWYVVVVYPDGLSKVMHKDDADATLAMLPGLFKVVYEANPFKTEERR